MQSVWAEPDEEEVSGNTCLKRPLFIPSQLYTRRFVVLFNWEYSIQSGRDTREA